MSKRIKNYKKELKAALCTLCELPGHDFGMHLALATQDYEKIDNISSKVMLELVNNYIALNEMDEKIFNPESFNFDAEDEDEEDLING